MTHVTSQQVRTAIEQLSSILAGIPPEDGVVWQATRHMPRKEVSALYRKMDDILIAATKFKMSLIGSHIINGKLGWGGWWSSALAACSRPRIGSLLG